MSETTLELADSVIFFHIDSAPCGNAKQWNARDILSPLHFRFVRESFSSEAMRRTNNQATPGLQAY